MGRGQALRTKIKDEILASQTVAVAMEEAHRKIEARKPFKQSLHEHLGKFIDRLQTDDLLKISSVVVLTIIYKPVLQASGEIMAKISNIRVVIPVTGVGVGPITYPNFMDLVLGVAKVIGVEDLPSTQQISEMQPNDLNCWILAFSCAILTVYLGPSVLSAIGGVSKLAGFLLT